MEINKCAEHSRVCGDLGGINANITNLTAAVVSLTAQINNLTQPIHERINGIEREVNSHAIESVKYREKILVTEKLLQDYMLHQKAKSISDAQDRKDTERKVMQRMTLIVAIVSIIVQVVIRVFLKG